MTQKRIRYTVNNVSNNRFYQLPKFLFEGELKALSNNARILYALLRDRHSLSLQNQWFNEKNEVYLIYTRKDMEEMLGLSDKPVKKAMDQLKEFGLIEEERIGLNMPNRIYLTFVDIENTGIGLSPIQEIGKSPIQESVIVRSNNTDINNTDINNTDFINQSVCQEKEDLVDNIVEIKKQTDRKKEIATIYNKAEVHLYQGEYRKLIENAILNLLELKQIQINNKTLNNKQIKQYLKQLTINHIDYAFAKFRQAQQEQPIRNKFKYFQILLLNSIEEYPANAIY